MRAPLWKPGLPSAYRRTRRLRADPGRIAVPAGRLPVWLPVPTTAGQRRCSSPKPGAAAALEYASAVELHARGRWSAADRCASSSVHRPTRTPANRPARQPDRQLTGPPNRQLIRAGVPVHQPTRRPDRQLTRRPVRRSAGPPARQSASPSVRQSVSPSVECLSVQPARRQAIVRRALRQYDR